MDRKEIGASWFQGLQERICLGLETIDSKGKFKEDIWTRPGGGGGRSRIIQQGKIIEKGGVNFSSVHGKMPANLLEALGLQEADFFATGVSIVLHPINPWMPIIHMNIRYFEMTDGPWWFGGGIDLTPHYVFPEDGGFLHRSLKEICDTTDPDYYPRFKKWADDYFFLKHRQETRGIGGIFFDRLNEESEDKGFDTLWAFVQKVGEGFLPVYSHYASKYGDLPFTEANKRWQHLRRGRYVEFNLVWDKGTRFGLDTEGRTESILMSLPPDASWAYDYHPEKGSPEEETLSWLKKEINWLEYA